MKVYSVYQDYDYAVSEQLRYIFFDESQAKACVSELNKQYGKPGEFVYYEQTVLPSWDQKTKSYNFDVHKKNNKIKVGLRDVDYPIINYGLQFYPLSSASERRIVMVLRAVAVRARNLAQATKRAQRLVDRYFEQEGNDE